MSEFPFDISHFPEPIGPDVLGALKKLRFFERLDDRLCPADAATARVQCGHSFANSIRILRNLAIDLNDVQVIILFFRAQGVRCDCGVLTKVADESRFRAASGQSHEGSGSR
jgi:hypothetical protein